MNRKQFFYTFISFDSIVKLDLISLKQLIIDLTAWLNSIK